MCAPKWTGEFFQVTRRCCLCVPDIRKYPYNGELLLRVIWPDVWPLMVPALAPSSGKRTVITLR
jgi:hypothetical protein